MLPARPVKPERRMSDNDPMSTREQGTLFKNEETRLRRAWIERALSGARRRLAEADPALPSPRADAPPTATEQSAYVGTDDKPRLYLVSGGKGA